MADELETPGPAGEVESPDTGATGADSPSATSETTPKDGLQSRIDEITRKRYDAEREAAYWRGQAEAKKLEAPAPAPKELNPSDFDSDSDYLKAVAKQTRDQIKSEMEQERNQIKEQQKKTEIMRQYDKGRQEYSDFDAIALSSSVPITQVMFDAATGDNLASVLYSLGKNPAEAARIAALPAVQQIKEIGKIEARLVLKPPTPKKHTGAPDPPSTVTGTRPSSSKKESEMTRAELHVKWEADRRQKLGVRHV